MGKQELKQRETRVSTQEGIGKQLEQTLTVDDNCLPSPEELAAYQKISNDIVPFLIEVSKKEQEHRHKAEMEKIRIIGKTESRTGSINWWGMCFAFLSIVVLAILSAYALYFDKPWFAGSMGAGVFVSIASVFIRVNTPTNKDK